MRAPHRGDRGATALELALLAPLLLTIVGGLLVFGLRSFYGGVADYSAKEAARHASIPDGTRTADGRRAYPSEAAVGAAAASAVPGILGAPSAVEVCPPTCTPACSSCSSREGQPVAVTVTWDVPVLTAALSLVPFLNSGPDAGQVVGTASRRRE